MVNNQHDDHDRQIAVRVPSIEVADKIMFGLTARQLAYAATTIIVVFGTWQATSRTLGSGPAVVGCGVLGMFGAVLVFAHRDGTSIDRLLWAALRRPRHPLVPTGDGPAPHAAREWTGTVERTSSVRHPAGLHTPIRGIASDGTIDLGHHGLVAVLLVTGLVNFTLLAPGEQRMLTARLARAVSALTGPIQILSFTTAGDHTRGVNEVINALPLLPPEAARAAEAHAAYLEDLAAHRSPTRRHVFITVPAATPQALARRLGEVGDAFAGCGLAVRRVDGFDVGDLIATICDPHPFDTLPEEQS